MPKPNKLKPLIERRKERYKKGIKKLLDNTKISKENKDFYKQFFAFEEKKLKRTNDMEKLDEGTYHTLYYYTQRFLNVERWFNYKPYKKLTKKDIEAVYDGLEDGVIVKLSGKGKGEPYQSRRDYYEKIFKSKPFEMVGKADLAREVIQYQKPNKKAVRYITEEDFKKIVSKTNILRTKLLLWLAWDYGENINALLQLTSKDFHKQKNKYTGEPEYRVNFKQEILKRSRTPRSELTNYSETVVLLDDYLKNLKPNEKLFTFEYAYAKKILNSLLLKVDVVCSPNGEKVTWKDFRSGMACHLLQTGWNRDEVNARLGHKPSSTELDKYINYFALDRSRPKKKIQEFEVKALREEIEALKEANKLEKIRADKFKEEVLLMLKDKIKKKK